ncbi:HNH endonuclease [Halorussus ruber]|uniref:HNH endonuclease n=1 Tax=Halorussus ruber TaxID=1126238 RepID=UPI00109325C9|nr:HNH endonuclease signature motif containing protein [Halorussus ruber]
MAHDERLPNRECKNCGEEFYCEYQKKYCSDSCRNECLSSEGPSARNDESKTQLTDCEFCEVQFEYYPSAKKGLYCPTCVEERDWRTTPDVNGADNPRWSGGKVEFECEVCTETVERYPSEVTGEVTVCGEECRAKWLSESFAGSGHPNWEGGDNGSYGRGWNSARQTALERDDYECVICSKSKGEIGRNPDVHHIVPVRAFAESENHSKTDAHYLDNLISLCIGCHRKADFGKLSRSELRSHVESRPTPPLQ